MELLLLILLVLLGFFSGTYILGNFFSRAFIKLPEVLRGTPSEKSELSPKAVTLLLLETIGWLLLLISLIFLIGRYFADYQKIFLCGIYVSLAFHIGTLLSFYRKPS